MKETAIEKINKMGKIGSILIIIAKIICIIGLVATIVSAIVVGCIPKDFILFSAGGKGTMEVNLASIDQHITDQEREDFNNNAKDMILTMGDEHYRMDEMSAKGDVITFSTSGDMPEKISLHDMWYVIIIAAVSVAMTLVTLFFAGFLCDAIKDCQSPFEENVIRKMRNFAYSLIPWVVLGSISNSVLTSVKTGKMNITLNIDISTVFVVLIVLTLVYIFRYGAILQQESDETL